MVKTHIAYQPKRIKQGLVAYGMDMELGEGVGRVGEDHGLEIPVKTENWENGCNWRGDRKDGVLCD